MSIKKNQSKFPIILSRRKNEKKRKEKERKDILNHTRRRRREKFGCIILEAMERQETATNPPGNHSLSLCCRVN